jgi:uncharacterized membrane protein
MEPIKRVKAEALSQQLRQGSGDFLEQRRGVVVLSLGALGCMALIGLYQMGIIKHLPEPSLPGLDAEKVDASAEAYSYFSTPDAFLGLGSYAATMALAATGGNDRSRTQPWIPLALAAKAGFDAFQAAKLSYDQYAKHRAACVWCLMAAAATWASAALVVPEAKAALREVQKRCSSGRTR